MWGIAVAEIKVKGANLGLGTTSLRVTALHTYDELIQLEEL